MRTALALVFCPNAHAWIERADYAAQNQKQAVVDFDGADSCPIGVVLGTQANKLQNPVKVTRSQALAFHAGKRNDARRQLHFSGGGQDGPAVGDKDLRECGQRNSGNECCHHSDVTQDRFSLVLVANEKERRRCAETARDTCTLASEFAGMSPSRSFAEWLNVK